MHLFGLAAILRRPICSPKLTGDIFGETSVGIKVKNHSRILATALILGALLILQFSPLKADAAETSDASVDTPVGQGSKAKGTNAVPGADQVDQLITNANLRALSGSKSRWSISNSIGYDGGTVSAPFAEGRPNISGASATSVDTDINDTLNIKLSLNPFNAIMLGFGVRKMAPFTGSGPSGAYYASGGKDMDIYDPSLTYQYVYKMGMVQSVAQLSGTYFTRADIAYSANGNLSSNFGFDQENIIEFGNLSVGGSIGISMQRPTDNSYDYSMYQFWLDPYAEYKVSDFINLRTVANVWTYERYQFAALVHDAWTESVGVGFSVTRDIFIYPNVQFLPQMFNWTLTNVGVSATINLM